MYGYLCTLYYKLQRHSTKEYLSTTFDQIYGTHNLAALIIAQKIYFEFGNMCLEVKYIVKLNETIVIIFTGEIKMPF